MEQLHKGIYKLTQGLVEATKLNNDFANQMTKASNLANITTYVENMMSSKHFFISCFTKGNGFKI